MATGTEVTYETRTIRAVRGMEPRTIKKWEADGWELVSQSPGKVQTELTFRRPKPKSRRLLWIIGGGVLVLEDIDLWSAPLTEMNDEMGGFFMMQMSRGAREAMNLIRS